MSKLDEIFKEAKAEILKHYIPREEVEQEKIKAKIEAFRSVYKIAETTEYHRRAYDHSVAKLHELNQLLERKEDE